MLRLEGVDSGYGKVPLLRDITLRVKGGEVTALIGPNGAGKTTLMRTIVGALRISAGTIFFNDTPISGRSMSSLVEDGISLVPEGRRIFSGLTVTENLRVGAFVCDNRIEEKRRITEIFDIFPRLKERRRELGTSLSGGEQQLLAIARSLMSNPKLLLLDEPSLGLAPRMVEQVYEVVRLLKERGTTIFLVEQNAHRALTLADHAYVLETGRIVMSGSGKDLITNQQIIDVYLGT